MRSKTSLDQHTVDIIENILVTDKEGPPKSQLIEKTSEGDWKIPAKPTHSCLLKNPRRKADICPEEERVGHPEVSQEEGQTGRKSRSKTRTLTLCETPLAMDWENMSSL